MGVVATTYAVKGKRKSLFMHLWRIHETEISVVSGEVNRVVGRQEWEGESSQNILLFLWKLKLGERITY